MEPPSDLRFKILNENSVEMSWRRPSSRIEGFRIQVVSDSGQCGAGKYIQKYVCLQSTSTLSFYRSILLDEAVRDFILDAYTSVTSITDLTPDLDYSVSINSFDGSEESIPLFGQLTSKYICPLNVFFRPKRQNFAQSDDLYDGFLLAEVTPGLCSRQGERAERTSPESADCLPLMKSACVSA